MDKAEYRNALKTLRLSQVRAARWLGISARTSQAYALGERPIPRVVELCLRRIPNTAGTPANGNSARPAGKCRSVSRRALANRQSNSRDRAPCQSAERSRMAPYETATGRDTPTALPAISAADRAREAVAPPSRPTSAFSNAVGARGNARPEREQSRRCHS